MSEKLRLGEAAKIPSAELLQPKEDDPVIDLNFICEGVPTGKPCGKVTVTLNLRTGHVFDNTPNQEVGMFWIDAQGQNLLTVVQTRIGQKELENLIIRGHGFLRHPTSQGAIVESKR